MFVIQNENLISSAKNYAAAKASYDQTLNQLYTALTNIHWEDRAGESWRDVINEAKNQFNKVSQNLGSNNELLGKVANKAEESQASINSRVKNIYNTSASETVTRL
jgi:hypothetical protein